MGIIGDILDGPFATFTGLVVLGFALYLGFHLAEMAVAFFREEPPPEKPKPKPREYRVIVEDEDGWPMRSYILSSPAVGRLMRELDRRPPA